MKAWELLHRSQLLKDRWLTLYADSCRTAAGLMITPYYVMQEPTWVHIVAQDDAGRILIVNQYRHAAGIFCEELPGGAADAGEDPRAAAQRELREETGFTAKQWRPISILYANPARQTNRVLCFLAQGLSKNAELEWDEAEEMTAEFVPPAELIARIHAGRFVQSMHVASLLLALRELEKC